MIDIAVDRFEELVADALDAIPEELVRHMDNVVIQVVDEPHPGLFGLYEGIPLTDRGSMEPYLPDRISIFRGPIERISASPRRQADIVRDTVVHEIAHHFGISDERLGELGLGDED